MRIVSQSSEASVLAEVGRRLLEQRLQRNLTQAELAHEAGVSKRTVERVEAGDSVQWGNLVRLLLALDLAAGLQSLVPEEVKSPIEQAKAKGRVRQRASRARRATPASEWRWDDDA